MFYERGEEESKIKMYEQAIDIMRVRLDKEWELREENAPEILSKA